MTTRIAKNLGLLAFAVAAVCTTGCNKDKPEVGTTTVTSSEIELNTGSGEPTSDKAGTPTQPKDDYLATVRREQVVLRSRIDDEIRLLDRRIATTSSAKQRAALSEKRDTLKDDATVLDRADERGWDELKAVVQHDLEGQPQL